MTGPVTTSYRDQETVMTPQDKKAIAILKRPVRPYFSDDAARVLQPLVELGYLPRTSITAMPNGKVMAFVLLFREGRRQDQNVVVSTVHMPGSYGDTFDVFGHVRFHHGETETSVECASAIEAVEAATAMFDAMMSVELAPRQPLAAPVPAEANPA